MKSGAPARFSLRAATAGDAGTLFAIHELVFRDHIEAIWGWDGAWQRRRFEEEVRGARTQVVELAGEVAGYLQTISRPGELYLQNMALKPEFQGRGLGSELVRALQRTAVKRSVALSLRVFRVNERAQAFYERLGFVATDESDAFFDMAWVPDRAGHPARPARPRGGEETS